MIGTSSLFKLELFQALVLFTLSKLVKLFALEGLDWSLAVLVEEVVHPPNFPGARAGEFEHGDGDGSFEGGLVVRIGGEQ